MSSTKLRKVSVRSRTRRVILWIHLWLSLSVGVFILAIALSGVVLVFRDQTDRYIFQSELYRETPGTMAIEDAYRVAQEAYPDRQVEFVKLPEIVSGVYEARLAGEDETFLHATVDPGAGELLGDRGDPYKEGFNGWMFDLHVFLLSGEIGLTDETGIKIVGVVGIVLFVVLLTGIYLWWPGLKKWALGFKVRFRRDDRYIRNYDYHRVVGIVAVPILALIALTGVAFGFHETSRSVWYAVTFTEPPPEFPEEPPEAEPTGEPPLTLDALATRAAAETGAIPTRIHPPKDETGTVQVSLSAPWDPRAGYDGLDGNVDVWMNPYTGEVALKRDPREMPPAAKIFETWLFPLHVGSFGRMPVHVLYALVGLAPLVLAITGLTMWLLKRTSRRRRKT